MRVLITLQALLLNLIQQFQCILQPPLPAIKVNQSVIRHEIRPNAGTHHDFNYLLRLAHPASLDHRRDNRAIRESVKREP